MAFADAIPSFSEIPSQLRWDPDENAVQYMTALFVTVAEIAIALLAVASVAVYIGVGTDLSETLLEYELTLPLIGTFPVLVTFAFVGTVVAFPLAAGVLRMNGGKEHLSDDANAILVASAAAFLVGAVQSEIATQPTFRAGMLIVGIVYGTLYIARVVMSMR